MPLFGSEPSHAQQGSLIRTDRLYHVRGIIAACLGNVPLELAIFLQLNPRPKAHIAEHCVGGGLAHEEEFLHEGGTAHIATENKAILYVHCFLPLVDTFLPILTASVDKGINGGNIPKDSFRRRRLMLM